MNSQLNKRFTVVSFDPSLTHWGMATGHIDTGKLDISNIHICKTKKDNLSKIPNSAKDLIRARSLAKETIQYIQKVRPHVVIIEMPIGSQSASAMKSYGVCMGIIASLIEGLKIKVIQVSPAQVKLAACGNKNAEKQDMINWAVSKYPNINWPTRKSNGQLVIKNDEAEHMADAIGAMHAGVLTEEFKKFLTELAFGNNHAN